MGLQLWIEGKKLISQDRGSGKQNQRYDEVREKRALLVLFIWTIGDQKKNTAKNRGVYCLNHIIRLLLYPILFKNIRLVSFRVAVMKTPRRIAAFLLLRTINSLVGTI